MNRLIELYPGRAIGSEWIVEVNHEEAVGKRPAVTYVETSNRVRMEGHFAIEDPEMKEYYRIVREVNEQANLTAVHVEVRDPKDYGVVNRVIAELNNAFPGIADEDPTK